MSIEETLADREKRYGSFKSHAEISQSLKVEVWGHTGRYELACDQQEALDMIMHKVARILNGDPDYVDNWHDIAGYATLVENRLRGDQDGTNE